MDWFLNDWDLRHERHCKMELMIGESFINTEDSIPTVITTDNTVN